MVRRKCPTCWFTWVDTYNRDVCPKCHAKLPDGHKVHSRNIHTDVAHTNYGDIRREDKTFSERITKAKKILDKDGKYNIGATFSKVCDSPRTTPSKKNSSGRSKRKGSKDLIGFRTDEQVYKSVMSASKRYHDALKQSDDAGQSRAGRKSKTPKRKGKHRICPTCWFKWLDVYNKAECPKCHAPMPDGIVVGRRSIHTDEVRHRIGNNRHLDRELRRTSVRRESLANRMRKLGIKDGAVDTKRGDGDAPPARPPPIPVRPAPDTPGTTTSEQTQWYRSALEDAFNENGDFEGKSSNAGAIVKTPTAAQRVLKMRKSMKKKVSKSPQEKRIKVAKLKQEMEEVLAEHDREHRERAMLTKFTRRHDGEQWRVDAHWFSELRSNPSSGIIKQMARSYPSSPGLTSFTKDSPYKNVHSRVNTHTRAYEMLKHGPDQHAKDVAKSAHAYAVANNGSSKSNIFFAANSERALDTTDATLEDLSGDIQKDKMPLPSAPGNGDDEDDEDDIPPGLLQGDKIVHQDVHAVERRNSLPTPPADRTNTDRQNYSVRSLPPVHYSLDVPESSSASTKVASNMKEDQRRSMKQKKRGVSSSMKGKRHFVGSSSKPSTSSLLDGRESYPKNHSYYPPLQSESLFEDRLRRP